jgi:hypothetical protein
MGEFKINAMDLSNSVFRIEGVIYYSFSQDLTTFNKDILDYA